MSEGRMLADLIQRSHGGSPWHGPSRRALLDGVDSAMAAARPVAGAHSIWELVLHMTAWTREVVRRIRSGVAEEPEMGDWPPVRATDDAAWRVARESLDAVHADLVAAVLDLPGHLLSERVRDDRPGEAGTFSIRETIMGALQHDAYHCGQIALLKKQAQAARTGSARDRGAAS